MHCPGPLPMKGSYCSNKMHNADSHSLLQPPHRDMEGRNKIQKASKKRSVFLAVNAVSATKPRPWGGEQMLRPPSRPSLPYIWMLADFCRRTVGGTHRGGTSDPLFGLCVLSITASMAPQESRMTRENGGRHNFRAGACPSPNQPKL